MIFGVIEFHVFPVCMSLLQCFSPWLLIFSWIFLSSGHALYVFHYDCKLVPCNVNQCHCKHSFDFIKMYWYYPVWFECKIFFKTAQWCLAPLVLEPSKCCCDNMTCLSNDWNLCMNCFTCVYICTKAWYAAWACTGLSGEVIINWFCWFQWCQ